MKIINNITYLAFALFAFAMPLTADASEPTIITVDVPGTTGVTWISDITPDGTVTGSYFDGTSGGVGARGFLRTHDGTFTTFAVPDSIQTNPNSISPKGVITGSWLGSDWQYYGFVRAVDGSITKFDLPAGYTLGFTGPRINPAGNIVGTSMDPNIGQNSEQGFLRMPNGSLTTINFPGTEAGAGFTELYSINPAGVIAGDYCDATTCGGFVRSPDGIFTRMEHPGCGLYPYAINPGGAVVGTAWCGNSGDGYVWTPDGRVTLFDPPAPPGSSIDYTFATGINPAGTIVGWYSMDKYSHYDGFVRSADGTITVIDLGNHTVTSPGAINPAGVVTGSFNDATGTHGFLWIP